MLAAVGDLVEDVVVRLGGPVHLASDTTATITRRRGGSAANVAAAAATAGAAARFIGQAGTDHVGAALIAALAELGVDTAAVPRRGSTGTIVVIVDADGERTMLTDRRACIELRDPRRSWLDGVSTLHVPFYSLTHDPLATTSTTLIGWARAAGIPISIDVSSVSVLEQFGVPEAAALIERFEPAVVFANRDEAASLSLDQPMAGAITVVKRGADPALVLRGEAEPIEVPAIARSRVSDSTGAGDAFAAGFLTHPNWITDQIGACRRGHQIAAATIDSHR